MKRSLFKITVLLFLLSSVVTAQTKKIYEKKFPTTEKTKFSLRLTNAIVFVKTSPDDQIHIKFEIDFENYGEDKIRRVVDGIRLDTRVLNDLIEIQIASETKLQKEHYTLLSKEGFVLANDSRGKKANQYKSQDSILKEIKGPFGKSLFDRIKIRGENGEEIDIDKKEARLVRTRLIVQVPKDIHLMISGIDTQIFIENDLNQRLDINLKKGLFKAKKIEHKEGSIGITGAKVSIESLAIDKLMLQDVSRGLFGSIEDTECVFKGSRAEFGFIGKAVSVRDYNSKIFFYNFDKQFEELIFKGEYTELFVYDFEKKVKLKAKGSITLMFEEGKVISSSHSKGVKPDYQPTTIEKKAGESPYGRVEVNLENGVLHVISDKEQKTN